MNSIELMETKLLKRILNRMERISRGKETRDISCPRCIGGQMCIADYIDKTFTGAHCNTCAIEYRRHKYGNDRRLIAYFTSGDTKTCYMTHWILMSIESNNGFSIWNMNDIHNPRWLGEMKMEYPSLNVDRNYVEKILMLQ